MTSTTTQPHGSCLSVRPATWADKDRVLAWRNHPTTRAVSLGSGVIDPTAHARWFADVLRRDDRLLLIALDGGRAVASVRFDAAPPGWRVSLMVDPTRRGRGIGRRALEAAVAELRRREGITTVHAEVLVDNAASQRLFTAAGFAPVAVDGGVTTFVRPPDVATAAASSR